MRTKTVEINLRLSPAEYTELRLCAAENHISMTGYIRSIITRRKSLGDDFNLEFVQTLIKLKSDIGKATGMLKQAIASDKYNPKTFADLIKEYKDLSVQVQEALEAIVKKVS